MIISSSKLTKEDMPIIWAYLRMGGIETTRDVVLEDILHIEFAVQSVSIMFFDPVVKMEVTDPYTYETADTVTDYVSILFWKFGI